MALVVKQWLNWITSKISKLTLKLLHCFMSNNTGKQIDGNDKIYLLETML